MREFSMSTITVHCCLQTDLGQVTWLEAHTHLNCSWPPRSPMQTWIDLLQLFA